MSPSPKQPGSIAKSRRGVTEAQWSAEQAQRRALGRQAYRQRDVYSEFAVQEVHENYLVCKMYDGVEAFGDNINVARDPELRKTTYDGLEIGPFSYSYTGVQARTVTKVADNSTKDQIIIPIYYVPADGPAGYPGVIITARPNPVYVLDDYVFTIPWSPTPSIWCQWTEVTQRAWANVEEEV